MSEKPITGTHNHKIKKERFNMILKNKVAVIYGAGGAIGGAVARAFASEGAKLFLTGRRRAPVEAVVNDIVSAGGSAEAAEVDALNEQAVDKHLQSVIDKAGRVDISFNAIGILPIPASPRITTTCPAPSSARSHPLCSKRNSSSRPTNGVNALAAAAAASRPRIPLERITLYSSTRSPTPFRV